MIAVARVSREGAPDFDAAYRELWRAFVARALEADPVFLTRDEIPRLDPSFHTIPSGLAFQVTREPEDVPAELPRWRFRPQTARRDPYGAATCELYARAALDRAYVEAAAGRADRAARDLALARSFDPGWRADRLPPQPWGATETMGKSLAFFEALQRLDLRSLEGRARASRLSGATGP